MKKRNQKQTQIEILGGIFGQKMIVKSISKTHFLAIDSAGHLFTVHKSRAVVIK